MEQHTSALILAGGKSSRMGTPKAWLDFGGVPLIERIVERLSKAFDDIIVVSAPGQDLPEVKARLVEDEFPGLGPVAGMCAGLKAVRNELAFVCSCDVPFLNVGLAKFLASLADEFDVVVPNWHGRLHPLQAVYRKSLQPLFEQNIKEGKLRPIQVYEQVRVRYVQDDEICPIDPQGLSFLNLNTPDDYQAALKLIKERQDF